MADGGELLSISETISLRFKAVQSRGKPFDVLPLTFGKEVVAVVTLFSSLLVNNQMRLFFNVHSKTGFFLALVPSVITPTMTSYIAFSRLVLQEILAAPATSNFYPNCSICLHLRGVLTLSTFGLLLPFGFSFVASALAAISVRSYPVPDITDAKSMMRMLKLCSKSFRITGSKLLLSHALFGSILVNSMIRSNQYILSQQKIRSDDISIYQPPTEN
ncbi:unnamed protein product [Heterobilharzia americana]|nr:unnamed protein product [Heterobilharzia americana]